MAKKRTYKGITKEIKTVALKFAKFIENQGIPIQKLIIFGSYAKKKANQDSDIDLCIVSPKFGKDHIGELQFLLKQRQYIDSRIEPIPLSSKHYKEIESPLVYEIRKFGKEIRI